MICLVLAGCAKQGYPPGGPADTRGPLIEASYPAAEAIGVPLEVRPWVRLDEYPQPVSVEGAIFISPEPEEGFLVRVKGKRIEIHFQQPLPQDRTIVITFGSSLKDLNGNPLEAPYTLAFSTGQQIDRAAISGQIAGIDNAAATWVWAYPLEAFADPNPRRDRAPFAAQPDARGHYLLSFLPAGKYRVFAVVDSRPNRLWEDQTEALAFPPEDVMAAEQEVPELNLKLILRDLQPPKLLQAAAPHRQAIRLSFDESINAAFLHPKVSTLTGLPLSIMDVYQNPADSSAVWLTTVIQREGDLYQLHLDSVPDFQGNLADSIFSEIPASTLIDITGPRLSWSAPKEGDLEVDLSQDLLVGFDESIVLTDLPRAIHLYDSSKIEVEGTWSFPGSAWGRFHPREAWQSNARYQVLVYGDSLRDIFANTSPDSLVRFGFRTIDLAQLGSISGKIKGAAEDLRVVFVRLGKQAGLWETAAQADGRYLEERLPSGAYRLWIYQDRNRDQQYSPGGLNPCTFSEPFVLGADSVTVRPRWETEGVDLLWNPGQEAEDLNPDQP